MKLLKSFNFFQVVLSCPRYLSDKDREYILDYMFGQMCVDAVYMQEQALLALYSYNVTTGVIGEFLLISVFLKA